MPGALELLNQIKEDNLIPVVVTGSGQKSLLERLNRNFPNIFKGELMVTAFDVKYGKPNPEPYLMGLQKAGVKANEAIVVEKCSSRSTCWCSCWYLYSSCKYWSSAR